MIVDVFINLLISIVSLLPSAPKGFSQDFNSIYEIFNTVNYYFPVSEFFICLSLYIAIFKFKLGFNAIKWVCERIVI